MQKPDNMLWTTHAVSFEPREQQYRGKQRNSLKETSVIAIGDVGKKEQENLHYNKVDDARVRGAQIEIE